MTKKIKVLLVGPIPPPYGGIPAYVESLMNSNIDHVEFHIFNTALPSKVAPLDREGKMAYSSILENGIFVGIKMVLYVVWSYLELIKIIWEFRPNIVQAFPPSYWGYWRNLFYILLAKIMGRKVILHLLNAIDVFYSRAGKFQKYLLRVSLNMADAYILQSPKLQEWVRQYSHRRVFGIWNGIDLTLIPTKNDFRNQTIQLKKPVGITVGKLGENKGTPIIMSALENLKAKGIELGWVFVGGGDIQGFQYLAKQKGLEGQVLFTGSIDEAVKWEYLYNADFFCLPSFAEGQPISIIEAMAAGLPIISTNVGSIPEIVGNQMNGLVIPVGDWIALMQAIQFLSENPTVRKVMGDHSRRLVIERHNMESLFKALGNIYRELIPV